MLKPYLFVCPTNKKGFCTIILLVIPDALTIPTDPEMAVGFKKAVGHF